MKRLALVTGANGFLGSSVARQLLAGGWNVRALVRHGSDRRNIDGLDIEVVEGDLRSSDSRAAALAGTNDLFHVAADYRLWVPAPDEMYASNVTATEELVCEASAAGVERMVYTSSVATLGLLPDGAESEETTPSDLSHMIGHYKRSKFLAEQAVQKRIVDDGLPIVIVNPSTPVGPRDVKPTPTGKIVIQMASNKMPAYVDTGLNVVHVDDVAAGHLLAWEHGKVGERYILGGENFSLRDLAGLIAGIAGTRPPMFKIPAGAIMPIAYAAECAARLMPGWEPPVTVDGVNLSRKIMFFSSRKAEEQLGYRARPAVEALQESVDWFRANGYL
jgi:dihydroflavonol-4-reductase